MSPRNTSCKVFAAITFLLYVVFRLGKLRRYGRIAQGELKAMSVKECPVCRIDVEEGAPYEAHLLGHVMSTPAGPTPTSIPSAPFKCDVCSAEYKTLKGLNAHKTSKHSPTSSGPSMAGSSSSNAKPAQEFVSSLICPRCMAYMAKDPDDLRDHFNNQCPKRSFDESTANAKHRRTSTADTGSSGADENGSKPPESASVELPQVNPGEYVRDHWLDATQDLKSKGYTVNRERQYSTDVSRDRVISAEINGNQVMLLVSDGQAPVTEPAGKADMAEKKADEATVTAKDAMKTADEAKQAAKQAKGTGFWQKVKEAWNSDEE